MREKRAKRWRSGGGGGGGRRRDVVFLGGFLGEECVAAAEPTGHSSVLYQPVQQPCTAQIKHCTGGLLLGKILRYQTGLVGVGGGGMNMLLWEVN